MNFFKAAGEALSTLEELRVTFKEPIEGMNELGQTEELVEPKLIEAIKLFFWSCSAHKDGQILLTGIKIQTDPFALMANCDYMDYRTWDFSDDLKKVIAGLTEGPKKIAEVVQKMPEIIEKFKGISSEPNKKIDAAGLNPMDKVKAVANTALNIKTVASGIAKFPKMIETIKDNLKEALEAAKEIPQAITHADEVGAKAHAKDCKRLYEIFEHFQTAPKKTKEEVEADKKAKESKGEKKKVRVSKNAPKGGKDAKKAK